MLTNLRHVMFSHFRNRSLMHRVSTVNVDVCYRSDCSYDINITAPMQRQCWCGGDSAGAGKLSHIHSWILSS